MQIKFTPKKIKESKVYISNLIEKEKRYKLSKKRDLNSSFFKKIFSFFFK